MKAVGSGTTLNAVHLLNLLDGGHRLCIQVTNNEVCPYIVSEVHKASVLFDEAAAEDWLAALDGQDHVTDLYIVTANKARFEALKGEVQALLGPILVPEEEKRALADGFAANLAYCKLEFLDKDQVALKRPARIRRRSPFRRRPAAARR
jgi:adenine-specific DNA-methyltransferase